MRKPTEGASSQPEPRHGGIEGPADGALRGLVERMTKNELVITIENLRAEIQAEANDFGAPERIRRQRHIEVGAINKVLRALAAQTDTSGGRDDV